ncbi:O-methyltransferase [Spectribacter hydrogenooxidans]|uniref:Class I SAM-dependent methyltransferase n=1 Tax=Spectribacter hydrogenoxidans TaxID=3075608 RepID=A0ABU3BY82_9GAMM|nr:class I SAM-dependent methyltransferase [Salinisphaera sp. W335]MDT0634272.1 class I SAM-dependent methyltransferase [Salinisphaera sp. W335]
MSQRSIGLPPALHDYLCANSLRESEPAAALRAETSQRSDANMQIAPEQGQLMALLLRLMGARRGIEIGVYTGYSALCMAEALPRDGHLLACDINPDTTAIGRTYWARAGVADIVDLHIAPALETLDAEVRAGHLARYDFAFIDADKTGTIDYYERCMALVRPGGLIMLDNTLWDGRVADETCDDEATEAIRAANRHLAADDRVDLAMVPIADGLTLAYRR